MKNLFKLVAALLLVLIVAVGGLYMYSTTVIADIVLEANLEEMSTYEMTALSETESVTTGKATIEVPFADNGKKATSELELTKENNSQTEVVDVENAKAEITAVDGSKQELTLEQYDATANPFKNFTPWKAAIDAKEYTVEDVEFDGEPAWKYVFNDNDELDANILANTKASATALLSGTGSEGIEIVVGDIEFDGNITVEVIISKESYEIKQGIMTADAPITLNFEFKGEMIDQLAAQMEKEGMPLGENDAKGFYKIENLVATTTFTKTVLKDGKSVPTNPLLVFLGTTLGM